VSKGEKGTYMVWSDRMENGEDTWDLKGFKGVNKEIDI
jgi:hypothetical protein